MRKTEALNLKPNDTVKVKATGITVVVKLVDHWILEGVAMVEDSITGRRYRHDELTK